MSSFSIDFGFLCEQVLLEHVLHNFFHLTAQKAIEAKKQYDNDKRRKKEDKKTIHNDLYARLKDLNNGMRHKLVPYKQFDSVEEYDKFLMDKSKGYPGLALLRSNYILPIL